MLARQNIEEVLARYARAIDRLDLDLLKTVFHEDGVNHEYGGGQVNLHRWAEHIIPQLKALFGGTMHHITHKSIVVSGDRAASEAYFISYHLIVGGRAEVTRFFGAQYAQRSESVGCLESGHEYIGGGRYLHRWEQRNGQWKIAERTATLEWNHYRPATPAEPGCMLATIVPLERRDRDDPVYRLFASLPDSSTRSAR
jgi:SnoaL-like domain